MSINAVPSPVPSASDDAESLRKALQRHGRMVTTRVASAGWRADKGALTRILCRRTAAQRAAIRRAYAFLYREPLLNCFRYKLSRHCLLSLDFWKAMILWTMDPAERDANLVHEALKKKQRDETYYMSVLIEMLVRLVSSYRYEGDECVVDMDVVRMEASQLAEAIKKKKQPRGEDEVVRIVTTRSKSQLRATFQRYREDHGSDIAEDIDSHCIGQFGRMLKTAVWCLTSPEKHFAEVIRHSILGLGTYEDMLTRVIVSRAEIDMRHIREEYKVRYKTTVTRDVVGDTSFGYKGFLLALVGRED
uniref:Annexin n=1 Tax=Oryza sativa subsp. japonica TaxID=39947 RepID=Q8H5B8_ORYSJ|nr:annexin-like protein [Oryza sativa Japonica Group]BAD30684.1 annexin-like protein [Oryza sativa Japonica Group]